MKTEKRRFDPRIAKLRALVIERLGMQSSDALSDEIDSALDLVCGMRHPGVAALLIRSSTAHIVYDRRYVVEELKRNGHVDVADWIRGRPADDDQLVVVTMSHRLPRSCVLRIGGARMQPEPLWPSLPPMLTRKL